MDQSLPNHYDEYQTILFILHRVVKMNFSVKLITKLQRFPIYCEQKQQIAIKLHSFVVK